MLKSIATVALGTVAFLLVAGLFGLLEMPIFRVWRALPFIDHRSLLAFVFVFSLGPLAEEAARLVTSMTILRRADVSAATTISVGLSFGLVERILSWVLYAGARPPALSWLYDFRAVAGHGGLSASLWLLLRFWRVNPFLALGACTTLHVATNLSTRFLPDGFLKVAVAGVMVIAAYLALIGAALWLGRSRSEREAFVARP